VLNVAHLLTVMLLLLTAATAVAVGAPLLAFFRNTLWLVLMHFAAGSLGNAGAGYELKMPQWFVIYQCFMQDTIICCYTYALFAWAFKRFKHWPIIGPNITAAHQAAIEHSHIIRPYGMIGLSLFVIVPMWATGPIVGTIIGYIIGLGAFTTLATISVSCLVCTIFYVEFYGWLRDFHPGVALGLLGVLLFFAIMGSLVGIVRYLWVKEEKAKAAVYESAEQVRLSQLDDED